jgi:hypothetical protein
MHARIRGGRHLAHEVAATAASPEVAPVNTHKTLAEAYVRALKDVAESGERVEAVSDPTSVGSGFGTLERPTYELLGYGFRVTDPRSCQILSPPRITNLPYCIGNLAWTVAGSDHLRWIAYFNPRGSNFSDDEVRLFGAFGTLPRASTRLLRPSSWVPRSSAACSPTNVVDTSR